MEVSKRRRREGRAGDRRESKRVRLSDIVRQRVHREPGAARDAVHVQAGAVQGEPVQPRQLIDVFFYQSAMNDTEDSYSLRAVDLLQTQTGPT